MRGIHLAGRRVLEIGFGSGAFLTWARDQGAEVVGTEINEASLVAAREAGVEILDAAIEEVAAFNAERFDAIVAFDVLSISPGCGRLPSCRRKNDAEAGGSRPALPECAEPFGLPPQNGNPTHRSALSRSVFEQLCQQVPFEFVRYAPSYRVSGKGAAKRIIRAVRGAMRDGISRLLNFVYASDIPWDSVVVLVLRKSAGSR